MPTFSRPAAPASSAIRALATLHGITSRQPMTNTLPLSSGLRTSCPGAGSRVTDLSMPSHAQSSGGTSASHLS
eukprot:11399735-Alexandrium_andersonii.AAC.1